MYYARCFVRANPSYNQTRVSSIQMSRLTLGIDTCYVHCMKNVSLAVVATKHQFIENPVTNCFSNYSQDQASTLLRILEQSLELLGRTYRDVIDVMGEHLVFTYCNPHIIYFLRRGSSPGEEVLSHFEYLIPKTLKCTSKMSVIITQFWPEWEGSSARILSDI